MTRLSRERKKTKAVAMTETNNVNNSCLPAERLHTLDENWHL